MFVPDFTEPGVTGFDELRDRASLTEECEDEEESDGETDTKDETDATEESEARDETESDCVKRANTPLPVTASVFAEGPRSGLGGDLQTRTCTIDSVRQIQIRRE